MTDIKFTSIATFSRANTDIVEPWLVALEEFGVATHLKFVVTGRWVAMAGLEPCGPDGIYTSAVPDDRLILPECAAGALIGRVGGSSATLKFPAPVPPAPADSSKPFAVGSRAVVKLPDATVGPLFLGFNILGRPVRVEALDVEILSGRP